jgi:hypothetical protein
MEMILVVSHIADQILMLPERREAGPMDRLPLGIVERIDD